MDTQTVILVLTTAVLVLPFVVRGLRSRRQLLADSLSSIDGLIRAGRLDQAANACDVLRERFRKEPDPEIRDALLDLLVLQSNALAVLERHEDTLRVVETALSQLRDTTDDPTRSRRTAALAISKGTALSQLGRFDDALAAYDVAVSHARVSPEFSGFLFAANLGRAACFTHVGRAEDAITLCDNIASEAFAAAKTSPDPLHQPAASGDSNIAAQAMFVKLGALHVLGRCEQLGQAFDEMKRRFERSQEPGILQILAASRELVREQIAASDVCQSPNVPDSLTTGQDLRANEQMQVGSHHSDTTRVTRAAYLDDSGEPAFFEVPGWVGIVPHVLTRGIDPARLLGQRYVERSWSDPASAPSKITCVHLRSSSGLDGMDQEFSGHLVDRESIASAVRDRLGPEAKRWTIEGVQTLQRA